VSAGGGYAAEGVDIEVLELTLASALPMIGTPGPELQFTIAGNEYLSMLSAFCIN
jgi:hypothetical protein